MRLFVSISVESDFPLIHKSIYFPLVSIQISCWEICIIDYRKTWNIVYKEFVCKNITELSLKYSTYIFKGVFALERARILLSIWWVGILGNAEDPYLVKRVILFSKKYHFGHTILPWKGSFTVKRITRRLNIVKIRQNYL